MWGCGDVGMRGCGNTLKGGRVDSRREIPLYNAISHKRLKSDRDEQMNCCGVYLLTCEKVLKEI
jgi:hypothetical protein